MVALATALGVPEDAFSASGEQDSICHDDRRLLGALQALRKMVSDEAEEAATDAIELQAREVRTALAEALAAMQSGGNPRI